MNGPARNAWRHGTSPRAPVVDRKLTPLFDALTLFAGGMMHLAFWVSLRDSNLALPEVEIERLRRGVWEWKDLIETSKALMYVRRSPCCGWHGYSALKIASIHTSPSYTVHSTDMPFNSVSLAACASRGILR